MKSLAHLLALTPLLALAGCDVGSLQSGPGPGPGGGPDGGAAVGGPDAGPGDPGDPLSNRVTSGVRALYTFEEGAGTIVRDVSGVAPALDLTIGDPTAVAWLPDALLFNLPTIAASPGPADKISQACQATGELTFEAWLRPAADQQPDITPRIVTLSVNTEQRNFMLGQTGTAYTFRLRTTATDLNGTPALSTPADVIGPSVQHVVYTRSSVGAATFYLDGVKGTPQVVAQSFANWDLSYRLAIGNELTGDRPWRGELYLVAVYCRELSAAEVDQNFAAGF